MNFHARLVSCHGSTFFNLTAATVAPLATLGILFTPRGTR